MTSLCISHPKKISCWNFLNLYDESRAYVSECLSLSHTHRPAERLRGGTIHLWKKWRQSQRGARCWHQCWRMRARKISWGFQIENQIKGSETANKFSLWCIVLSLGFAKAKSNWSNHKMNVGFSLLCGFFSRSSILISS